MAGLPPIQAALFDQCAERGDLEALEVLVDQLRSMSRPTSLYLGEPLLVFSQREHWDPTRLHWRYRVIGEASGEEYGELDLVFEGRELPQLELGGFGLALRIALNHPSDLPDSLWRAFAELSGVPGFVCPHCEATNPTWYEAVCHERDAHGIDPPPGFSPRAV